MGGAEILFIAVASVGVIAVLAIWQGYVLSILWGWFFVPLGLPTISIAHAIGIALVVGVLRGMPPESKSENTFSRLGIWFVGTLILLAVGYIAKGVM